MKFYHGSSVGGLTELQPFLSEHGKPYIYFSSDPAVALLYAVKPVPKPFSWYPYGFDETGVPVYSEYWQNAFSDIYKGKRGFLYGCADIASLSNPTAINCAYTCETPVKTDFCAEISDLYNELMQYEKAGLFKIRKFETVTGEELEFVYDDIRKTVLQYNLKKFPDGPMSIFIREHFPFLWNNCR